MSEPKVTLGDLDLSPTKHAFALHVSREMALMHGMVEPTPEEAAEMEARAREWHRRSLEAWSVYDEMVPALDALTDPVSRAVLNLHARSEDDFGPECDHCWNGDDREDWPCETVEAIAEVHGIATPEIGLHMRPDPVFTYTPLTGPIEYRPRFAFVDLPDGDA